MKRMLAAAAVLLAASCASGQDARIGYADEFDDVRGWAPKGEDMKISARDGVGVFHTSPGSWTKSFKWNDEPWKTIAGSRNLYRDDTWAEKSLGTIDFDRYHYIVAKVDRKGAVFKVGLAGRSIDAFHTTGLLAQDLRPLGIKGRQSARIRFRLSNNNTETHVDYFRIVSDLTPEEEKVLLPNPITIKAERVSRVPYDGLDALNARAARPTVAEPYEDKCAFIDPGTGTRKWKMSDSDGHENFSEYSGCIWRHDGASFYARGRPEGLALYRYAADEWEPIKVIPGGARYSYYWKWLRELYKKDPVEGKPGFKTFAIMRQDNQTGEESEITRIETWEHWAYTEWKDRGDGMCTFALREAPAAWVIHVNEKDPAKRVRHIKLPSRLKGFGYDHEKQQVSWHTCYTYEGNIMDLETGKVRRRAQHKSGHGPSGRLFQYGSITSRAKGRVFHGAGHVPGEMVKLAGVYATRLSIDYGSVSGDNEWIFSDGTSGDVANQHCTISMADGGTILRMATRWTSYAGWDRSTRGGASQDYTKYAYLSDMLGDGDYYFATIRNPDPPRKLAARRRRRSVTLTWEKPDRCIELRGYNVYRADKSGRGFERVNAEPVKGPTYVDRNAPAPSFYMVAMEEHSGLEGYFSNEASADYAKAESIVLHYDAATCEKVLPMREVLGGGPPYYRYLRVTKVMDGEERGKLILDVDAPKAGAYDVWGRVRRNAGGGGGFGISRGSPISFDSREWKWKKSPKKRQLRKGPNRVELASGHEDDCVERVILTDDDAYTPGTLDDRKTSRPSKPTGLKVVERGPNRIRIEWDKAKDIDFSHWRVYVSEAVPDDVKTVLGNANVIQSGRKPFCLDWGIKPDTMYQYLVVARDRRGNASEAATISARTDDLDVVTRELDPKGFPPAEEGGVKYVTGQGDVRFDFELDKGGDHYVWLKYSPRDKNGSRLAVSLGGASGDWRTKAPGRLGRALSRTRWFVDRVKVGSAEHRVKLVQGRHSLVVTTPKSPPWIAKAWITNDSSFTPPGFDVRAELAKRRR